MSKGIPIEEAKAALKMGMKWDYAFFWINFVLGAGVLISGNTFGLIQVGLCAYFFWLIRDKQKQLKFLDEMKKRGYRAT